MSYSVAMKHRLVHRTRTLPVSILAALVLLAAGACRTVESAAVAPPEPPVVVQPAPLPLPVLPEPEPEPVPEPEPIGPAPLEGPVWVLVRQYGEREVRAAPHGSAWLRFDPAERGRVYGHGGTNRFTGGFTFGNVQFVEAPQEAPIRFGTLASTRAAGPYLRYESLLFENLALVKGYYIQGERYTDSTLTLFGGVGREEIILLEFVVGDDTQESEPQS